MYISMSQWKQPGTTGTVPLAHFNFCSGLEILFWHQVNQGKQNLSYACRSTILPRKIVIKKDSVSYMQKMATY